MSNDLIQRMKARLRDPSGLMDLPEMISEARESGKRIVGIAGVETADGMKGMRVDVSKMYGTTVGELTDLTDMILKQSRGDGDERTKLAKKKRRDLRGFMKSGRDDNRKICLVYEEALLLLGETDSAAEVVDLTPKKKPKKQVVS